MANLTDDNWQQTSKISVQMSPIGTFKIISPLLGNPLSLWVFHLVTNPYVLPGAVFHSRVKPSSDTSSGRLTESTQVRIAEGDNTAHYWAMCHFYHGKPSWKWENQSSAQHWPFAVPKTSSGGQSLGQHWPPSAYRSYHSSNGTILEADLRQFFGDAGPVLGRI